MGTIADLILKAVQFLMGERKQLESAKRDQIDRVADYLERISDGLKDAAEKFATSGRPWDTTREMALHVNQLLSVVADSLKDDSLALTLRNELERAVRSDYLLLGDSRDRMVVDAITLKPDWRKYSREQIKQLEQENSVRMYSSEQLKQILADEVRKIEEASGLFRAVAVALRARPIQG
jgi:hypothetical protein